MNRASRYVTRYVVVLLALLWISPASASRPDIRVVPDAGVCGGMTLIASARHQSCVHPTADTYDGRVQAPWKGVTAATSPPVCYGDGSSGPRVQLFYGYLAGQTNRSATVVKQIRTQTAPRMQAVIKAASGGKDLGLRFAFDPGCKTLSVPVIKFPASTISGSSGNSAVVQFGRMIDTLQSAGYDRTDRKYLVIWDWWNDAGICGLGEIMPTRIEPQPINANDGLPTVGARTDVGHESGLGGAIPLPRYGGVWKNAFSSRGPGCWEMDQSKAGTQVHELFHTLGAVQVSAPHSDGGGHCTDTPSIMCSGRGRKPTVATCAAQPVQVLDCRMDDFWNPSPPPGSYLDNGPNIARSRFFGPQPQDQLLFLPI